MPFERNKPPSKLAVRVVIGLAAISLILSWFGELMLSQFVDRYPSLLIALNPSNKNLLLVQGDQYKVPTLQYYSIAFLRLLSSDPLYYLIGFWYGDKALKWARQSAMLGPMFKENERTIKNATYALVFVSPATVICALAAAVGISFKKFLAVNIAGTAFSLITIRWFGNRFGGFIGRLVDLIVRYRWQVFAISFVLLAWTIWREIRSKKSQAHMFKEIEEELDEDETSVS